MSGLANKGDLGQVRAALSAMKADDARFSGLCAIVWDGLSSGEREQLGQLLFQGPVWDGCVISKAARTNLIEYGLATRCCFRGEQGYTAATYLAFSVHKRGRGAPMKVQSGTHD